MPYWIEYQTGPGEPWQTDSLQRCGASEIGEKKHERTLQLRADHGDFIKVRCTIIGESSLGQQPLDLD